MQKKFEMAEQNVKRVQEEVDRLTKDPIMPEPSVWEEIERVWRLIPNTLFDEVIRCRVGTRSHMVEIERIELID